MESIKELEGRSVARLREANGFRFSQSLGCLLNRHPARSCWSSSGQRSNSGAFKPSDAPIAPLSCPRRRAECLKDTRRRSAEHTARETFHTTLDAPRNERQRAPGKIVGRLPGRLLF